MINRGTVDQPGGASPPWLGAREVIGLSLMDRPTRLIPVQTRAASGLILGGEGIVAGIAFRETAGAAASFDLLDGTDINGQLLFPAFLPANGTITVQMGRDGPLFGAGVFFSWLAGSVKGALWVKF